MPRLAAIRKVPSLMDFISSRSEASEKSNIDGRNDSGDIYSSDLAAIFGGCVA
jgi:hypothetical protein